MFRRLVYLSLTKLFQQFFIDAQSQIVLKIVQKYISK